MHEYIYIYIYIYIYEDPYETFGPLLTYTGFDFYIRNRNIPIVVMSDKNVIRQMYQIIKNTFSILQGLNMNSGKLFAVVSINVIRLQAMQTSLFRVSKVNY
jgi:hypothetical protein